MLVKTIECLTGNNLAILPCDTIYGICGKAPDTAQEIARVKGRHPEKPFLMLIHSIDQIKAFSDFIIPEKIMKLWPGALTLILPGKDGNTYAFRRPQHDFLGPLLKALDFPLFSTSVNKEGEAPLNKIDMIIAHFEDQVGLVIEGGEITDAKASTILDLCSHPYKIVRQGELVISEDILKG